MPSPRAQETPMATATGQIATISGMTGGACAQLGLVLSLVR